MWRSSDWSLDVCSSDLARDRRTGATTVDECLECIFERHIAAHPIIGRHGRPAVEPVTKFEFRCHDDDRRHRRHVECAKQSRIDADAAVSILVVRSEEHTSELQSLMRISYAVFCLNTKKN